MKKIIDQYTNLNIPSWKKYTLRHPGQMKIFQRKWFESRGRAYIREWQNKNRKKCSRYQRNRRIRKRFEILKLLGGKCNNPLCPVPREKMDNRCLQVDHIYGGGSSHERHFRSKGFQRNLLKEIKEHPENYQLLCAYCNWLKGRIDMEKKSLP